MKLSPAPANASVSRDTSGPRAGDSPNSIERGFHAQLDELAGAGRLRALRTVEPLGRGRARVDGREVLVFCSNDYLGLALRAELAEAAAEGATRSGAGAGASRLIAGSHPVHAALEAKLAALVGAEAALTFPTGYQANLGALVAVVRPADVVYSDALNHASLIDACRLAKARIEVVPHRSIAALDAALRCHLPNGRAWIVTESLFSMDGDEADLRGLARLAERHTAGLIVDEAHALGVFGPGGGGLCAEAGVRPDLLIGTLSKAFACAGGFVAGSRAAVDVVLNSARTFVFTTALAPPLASAAARAVELVADADGERKHLLALSRAGRSTLERGGVKVLPGRGPILPIITGDEARTMRLTEQLLERGYFVQGIRPPTVPPGASRLRVTLSADHSLDEVAALCSALIELLPPESMAG